MKNANSLEQINADKIMLFDQRSLMSLYLGMYIKFTKPQNINVSCAGLEPDKNQTPSCATQMSKNKSRTEVCICAKGQLI